PPLLVLVGAWLIPYIDRGNLTATRPSERKTAVVLFTMFCALGLTLTFVGIFFRGPGSSFVIPYLPFFENSSPGLPFSLSPTEITGREREGLLPASAYEQLPRRARGPADGPRSA